MVGITVLGWGKTLDIFFFFEIQHIEEWGMYGGYKKKMGLGVGGCRAAYNSLRPAG
jgi:hypothetical protein